MTEAGEPTGLVQEFIQAIKDGAQRITTYRDACTKFTDETRQYAVELKALIDRLEECIKQIEALQGEYEKFWMQLTQIQQNILILIKKAKQDAHKQGEDECDKKITQIRNEFTLMLNLIKSLKLNTKSGIKVQLDRLKSVIERLCGEGDSLVKRMAGNKDKTGSKVGDIQRVLAEYDVEPETASPRHKRRQHATSRGSAAARRQQGSRTQSVQHGPGRESTQGRPGWRGGHRRTRKRRGGFRYGKGLESISKSRRRNRRSYKRTKRSQSKSRSSKSKRTRRRSKKKTK